LNINGCPIEITWKKFENVNWFEGRLSHASVSFEVKFGKPTFLRLGGFGGVKGTQAHFKLDLEYGCGDNACGARGIVSEDLRRYIQKELEARVNAFTKRG
jgi:hypothetical protein